VVLSHEQIDDERRNETEEREKPSEEPSESVTCCIILNLNKF
jgi:hypothetical protein